MAIVKNPDVIVTGVGRSGTSTVARILHTKLNVCMGHEFHRRSEAQPDGSYEDTRMLAYGQNITGGFPFKRKAPIQAEDWLKAFSVRHASCKQKYIGVKSPHLSGCTARDWEVIAPKLIFRCWRPKRLVLASMNRWRNASLDWSRYIDEREQNMDEVFRTIAAPVCFVTFEDADRSDAELEHELSHFMKMYQLT